MTKFTFEELIGGSLIHEIDIETQDKIQLLIDGSLTESILNEDFDVLKNLLYKEVDKLKKKLDVEEIRRLLNAIDLYINESIEFIKKKIEERRKDENQRHETFRRNAKRKSFGNRINFENFDD